MPSAVMTTRRSTGRAAAAKSKIAQSLFRWIHAFGFQHRGSFRSGKYPDQRLRRLLVLRGRAQAGGIGGGVLDFFRQGPHEHDTLDGDDFTDLVHADLCLATDDQIGHVTAFLELRLGPDLVRDAKALEQLVEIYSA